MTEMESRRTLTSRLMLASWRWSMVYDVVDVEEIPYTTR